MKTKSQQTFLRKGFGKSDRPQSYRVHNVETNELVENRSFSSEFVSFAANQRNVLGLLVIYFFGKSYYDLAKLYGRNAWGYAILGSVIFLASEFLFGVLIGILIVLANLHTEVPSLVFSIASIAFAAFLTNQIEKAIRRNWEKQKPLNLTDSDLLDQ